MLKFLLLIPLLFILTTQTFASGTISVTPQIARIDLSTDQPVTSYIYKNTTNQTIELSLSIQNFKEGNEDGVPQILNTHDSENYKYGLTSWATLSSDDLTIPAGQTGEVKVFIDKTRLTLGGHYGSILAQIKQADENKRNVKLNAILAALLFVRSGSEYNYEEGKIASFEAESNLFAFPEKFILRFQNTGNVDVTPHGVLEVRDPLNQVVGTGIVNEDSLISLPETIRKYKIAANSTSPLLVPGIYHANLKIHFGKSNKSIDDNISFFSTGIFDIRWIVASVVVLIGLGLYIRANLIAKISETKR